MNGVDIGHNVFIRYLRWAPDRDLNPQYDGLPDVEQYGLIIDHLASNGEPHSGGIVFDSDVARRLEPGRPMWVVQTWEPLTISPSVLCECGHHGFVHEGRWVPA